ncbi:MAG: hypothetical protein ABL932_09625, partial [Terricaulis sp.]
RAHNLFTDEAGTAEHNDEIASTHVKHSISVGSERLRDTRKLKPGTLSRCVAMNGSTQIGNRPGNQCGAAAWLMFLRNDADATGLKHIRGRMAQTALRKVP